MSELERRLAALGRELAVPDAPDLGPAVLAQLEPRPQPKLRLERRRWVLAVAVAVLAALGATLAIPDARSAFFRVLHIGGERIEFVEDLPEVEGQAELEFVLGERVTLQEAERRSDFDLRALDEAPDGVYLGDRGTVWFLYGTPERVRLLVAQTPLLAVEENFALKKLAGPKTKVERVAVNGAAGLFLSGEPHFMFLIDENGQIVEESARLAAHVLIWDDGGVAYRLEGDFDREEALRIARKLD